MTKSQDNHHNSWPSYRVRAAEKISYHIGRLYRGMSTRQQILIARWRKYDLSAYIIQKSYRKWKNSQYQKALEARFHRLRLFCPSKTNNQDSAKCFSRLIHGNGSYEDRMVMWRLIIDLRRAYPQQSVETSVKAVIEARGDSHRAMTLLGLPGFSSRLVDDQTKVLKAIFFTNDETDSSSNRETASSQFRGGLKGLRSLKQQRQSSGRHSSTSSLDRHIAKLIETIYSSRTTGGGSTIPAKFKNIYAPSRTFNSPISTQKLSK
jgi:hypothetical protein